MTANTFGLFMDVDCSWPEIVHDVKDFSNSSISQKLRDERIV